MSRFWDLSRVFGTNSLIERGVTLDLETLGVRLRFIANIFKKLVEARYTYWDYGR